MRMWFPQNIHKVRIFQVEWFHRQIADLNAIS